MTDEPQGAPTPPLESLASYLKALGHAKRLQVLHFVVHPRSLEEIASELGVARQTAQEHVDQLLDLGFVQARKGRGDRGPVTQYSLVPQRLFAVHEMFGELGELKSDMEEKVDVRAATMADGAATAAPKENELPRLTVVHGMRIGQTSVLSGNGPWLLGRDPHATVNLDYDPYASARHAEVRRSPTGFELADLYSSNGTHVDWKKLGRGEVTRVDNGSLVRIGRTLILFRRGAAR